jgi:hypothetical protein
MKPSRYAFIAVLAWAVWQQAARAQEPGMLFDGCRWAFPSLCKQWQERKCWCPDDYCTKTLPCVPPNRKGCVDDYCPKPLPCVTPNAKGCVDDYCPKTCPLFLGKLCEPWYTCGQLNDGGTGTCRSCRSKQ